MEESLYDIIIRYLDGSASLEEREQLLNWLKRDKQNTKFFIELKDIWEKTGELNKEDDKSVEFALKRFKYNLSQRNLEKKNNTRWLKYGSVAAILAVIILSGILLLRQPLSGLYNKAQFTETIIPLGQKGKVLLPDGTKISLNSGTWIRYPSSFGAKVREVYLEGEAYFEVAHDKHKPFLVHSGNLIIKVLGTCFNLRSYPNENKIETTLVNGSVKILESEKNQSREIFTLKPNEQAVYNIQSRKIVVNHLRSTTNKEIAEPSGNSSKINLPANQKSNIQIESIYMWKEQKLIFEHETMEQMAQKLSRWYNKKVFIESDALKGEKYSGKFIYNETIYQVLEAIRLTTSIDYYEKDHAIYIQSKR